MKLVPNGVSRSFARQVLKTKKNSPHIFFVAGVAGVIGSTVLACRATLKLEPVIDEIRDDLVGVKAMGRPSESGNNPTYNDRQYIRDLGYVYGKSAVKLGRLYGPSVALGSASIAALAGSHIQLTRRNSALTATLALVSQAYDDYRDRVRAELGEARELDIYHGVNEETQTIDGKKKLVKTRDSRGFSPYAVCFDETNVEYKKDAELNRMFIMCQQNWLNHNLHARGHVMLNDVYDVLGFERTTPGAVVGWVLGNGDDYIDFGLNDPPAADFMNGLERSVWLDFNVDGVVYDLIEGKRQK